MIRLLPDGLVNRIAAGEVVERPAAVVKELAENALDAGATRVSVRLEAGGSALIEVADDGAGMAADQLALAVQRHCTSKLTDESLVRITTLGFRGEALPSIGAAGRLRLLSRPAGAPHASAITVEGGTVGAVMPASGGPGTTATVRDLFYATPARRKFLKAARTEAEHAAAALRRLALAAPAVAFRLESDGRVVFDLPAQSPAQRVTALLGAPADLLLPLDASRDAMRLTGFAAPASHTRMTTAGQSLVVNGRPVTDRLLATALRVAYRDVIAAGRHAVAALFVSLPVEDVDVNVHPAKTELRFRDPDAVRSLVIGALRRALAGGATNPALARPAFQSMARPSQAMARPPLRLVSSQASPPGFAEATLPLLGGPTARALPVPAPRAEHPLGAPLGQIFDTYVLAVASDGSLVLVDQHAAHERLTHELLRAQYEAGEVRRQPLLLPAVVDLTPAACATLLAAAPSLASLGLELEAFGSGALLVRALPAALGAPDPAPLLRDLADELAADGETTALALRIDAVLARLACHGSIRAGRRLQGAEMDALLRRMEATPRAATCSHGRPTVLKLTKAEIERLFGRR
ncbi:MAG: DNA mismatch repair endonuclease MutL [Acetobacteraceae bacterium]|nr:DNA mismatch repair endonuclease MutL [Acetobacteraceae bacterium]